MDAQGAEQQHEVFVWAVSSGVRQRLMDDDFQFVARLLIGLRGRKKVMCVCVWWATSFQVVPRPICEANPSSVSLFGCQRGDASDADR